MSEIRKESPLHYVKDKHPIQSEEFNAHELPFLGYINLRGDSQDIEFGDKISKITGLELPIQANRVNKNDKYEIYWMSPDEWLIVTNEDEESQIITQIEEILKDRFFAITNVTGGFTKIKTSGNNMRQILNKGTSFNLNPESFKIGRCTKTQFAHSAILICALENNEYDIIIRRSFAEYFWLYLVDSVK